MLAVALPQDNPHLITGALVQGPTDGQDTYPDVRTNNGSLVSIDYNAGFTGALAGLQAIQKPTWDQCLQGWGVLSSDPVCG